jgi:hypothetical protein
LALIKAPSGSDFEWLKMRSATGGIVSSSCQKYNCISDKRQQNTFLLNIFNTLMMVSATQIGFRKDQDIAEPRDLPTHGAGGEQEHQVQRA